MSDPITNTQFDDDNTAFLDAAHSVREQIQQTDDDCNGSDGYMKRLKELSSNPELALMQLFFILGASSGNNTVAGVIQDKQGVTGEQTKMNGALTAAGNDLNNMINSDNDNSDSLIIFANSGSILKGELSGDKTNPFYNKDLDESLYASNEQTMDGSTQQSVCGELSTIRGYFNVSDDGSTYKVNNPNDNGTTYYFDNKDTNYINSFKEYQDDLSAQGDPKQSTEAAKYITDDFATNTQSTQTVSAVLNNDMKTYSSLLQTVQQTDSGIAQSFLAVDKAAINHASTAS